MNVTQLPRLLTMRNLGGFFLCQILGKWMSEYYQKPALTYDAQLNLLQQRGLIIPDRDHALSQLSSISYYRLSAYWYPFLVRSNSGNVTNNFVDGSTFDKVVTLYEFDRHLRLLVIDAIERIEVCIRTLITYHLGHKYGAFAHTDKTNFHPKFLHAKWHSKLQDEVSRSSEAFISHYKVKYSGFPIIPIWMITEVMSFGTLSLCYQGLKSEDKKVISNKLHLHHKRLADWLHKLTYIRNICAHHSRLWNRELAVRPELSNQAEWQYPTTPRNDRIFYILLMLRHLLRGTDNGDDWHDKVTALISPIAANIKWRFAMGMPENWIDHPVWQ